MVKKYEKRKELVDIVQYISEEFIFVYAKDNGEYPSQNDIEKSLKRTLEEKGVAYSSAEYHGMLNDLLPNKPKQKKKHKSKNKKRTKLKQIGSDERYTFTGVFERTGFKSYRDKYTPTLMLKNIKIDDELLTDHLWFSYGKNFQKLGKLEQGDIVQLNGRVGQYTKGYYTEGQKVDYRIERPTKVKLLSNNHEFQKLPEENKELIGMALVDNKDYYSANSLGTVDDDYYINCYNQWKSNQKTK